ncbi:MAG TPA: glycosyltransferase family 2 protein [Bryobacteraceae bacterium]|nr:glycosyltransferase family 2 protein [Bryobacteraceae bacterium]
MKSGRSSPNPASSAQKGCPVNGKCSGRPRVSIIVPCRNEAASIETFLKSLLRQELQNLNWDAVIADGMSDDGTREVLRRFSAEHPRVQVIDNPSRIVSTGLNACIRAAAGDIIVRMDVHTEYKSDYVLRCVEVLQNTNAANVGGACIALQTGYVGRAIAGAFHSPFAVGGAQWHQPDYEGPVDTVHLGCWRREVLEQIGCFDESLVRNQDDELNFRLTRTGRTIWQSPEIVSWYHPRSSLGALFRQYFQYGFWKVAVIKKHRLPASWRHLIPGAFVLLNCALLLAVLLGAMTGAGPLWWLIAAGTAMDIAYAIAVVAAASLVARKDGWTLFPVLPLVFCSYHFGYGIGFLSGIYYFSAAPRSGRYNDGIFTELTR